MVFAFDGFNRKRLLIFFFFLFWTLVSVFVGYFSELIHWGKTVWPNNIVVLFSLKTTALQILSVHRWLFLNDVKKKKKERNVDGSIMRVKKQKKITASICIMYNIQVFYIAFLFFFCLFDWNKPSFFFFIIFSSHRCFNFFHVFFSPILIYTAFIC